MKKFFLVLILLLITITTIFGSEVYRVDTSLFYSQPGTIKSESRPVMRVGETWNLDFLFSTKSGFDIKQILPTINNFFNGTENAILIQLLTSISPNEFKIMSEVNLISLGTARDDEDNYLYYFSFSPKKDNQKLEIQLNIKEKGNHHINLGFIHIQNAGQEWFIKGTNAVDLVYMTTSDGYYVHNMSVLQNSQTNFNFIFE